jgi:hypothetical protein
VATIGKGWRISAVAGGENEPAGARARFGIRTALLQYRPKEGVEFAAGRDTLPTGLNIPDDTAFIQSRSRLSYYDTPRTAKAFVWGKRWRAAAYAYADNPNELASVREKGGGMLAEYDVLGKGRTVAGIQSRHGSRPEGSRNMFGVYTRLGFGRWGVLAEEDVTTRVDRSAGYLQLFFYPGEWLLVAAVVERLKVEEPRPERLWAYKGQFSVRFSPNWTISGRAGFQRNSLTGERTPVASIQLALKPVS